MNNGDRSHSPSARRFDVTLVGDTCLDLLLYGIPDELPPERELLADNLAIRVGGSGAITAHNLAALGNSVGFITTVPGDDFGRLCQSELNKAGVDLSRCVPVDHDQTGVTVHLQHRPLRHMFTYAGATFHLGFEDLDLAYLADTRHFHMSSYYLQRALTPRIPELFAHLKQAGVTISLDPNDDPAQTWDRCILDALPFVDVLMPNEREACRLATEPNLDRAIAVLRERVPLLIIKRGEQGASAYAGPEYWHVPARKTQVIDAVGAGDSFNAGFLHAWLRSLPVEKALAYGSFAGSLSTTASGGTSAFRDADSVRAQLCAWQHQ
ncbi:MAG TPA: sugar kinase [Terracidiphilus sp.]|jgi:sugar/nucleoside kinase (ribokinase family)|nr:sugar kinase [Terracidiphilus sp.]